MGYNQTRTRSSFFSLVLSKTNINIMSWLRLTLINAGLPPFLIFTGEVLISKAILIYPFLIFILLFNYILIGYYSCLMLIKLIFSKFPLNVRVLVSVGLTPYICNTIVFLHFLILLNIRVFYPWFF